MELAGRTADLHRGIHDQIWFVIGLPSSFAQVLPTPFGSKDLHTKLEGRIPLNLPKKYDYR